MLHQYYAKNKIELGLDEAGRGCLFGPVCVAGVIWNQEEPNNNINYEIKDSKKCTPKQKELLSKYIKENAIYYSIQLIDNKDIDNYNILESTMKGMHKCISDVNSNINIDKILVDGPYFNFYKGIPHVCIINGDNKFKSIAAASILAKTHRDKYIDQLVKDNPKLKEYDIHNNKGYGTKKHLDAIKKYGITRWHRKTFGICKEF